jgi:putative FmdB family regulatory protein
VVTERDTSGDVPAGSIPATPQGSNYFTGSAMSPIYQYKCDGCGWSIDINRPISERDVAPMCGDCLTPMARELSPVAAIFKGSGWGSSK